MIGINAITDIIIGLIFTVFLACFFYSAYDDLLIDHWIPPTIIVGIIFTLLVGFIGSIDDNNSKVKKKDCISYKTDDAEKSDTDKPDTISNSFSTASSTAVSLQQKIQDKIQSRYSDVVITGFDTIKMSGTFSCDNVQYSFQWKDNMLEVINADDADDVTYYKVAQ